MLLLCHLVCIITVRHPNSVDVNIHFRKYESFLFAAATYFYPICSKKIHRNSCSANLNGRCAIFLSTIL